MPRAAPKPATAPEFPMSYTAPVSEMRFLMDHVLDAGRLAATERFAEANAETRDAVLAEAARLSEDVLAPLRRAGDLEPARIENGIVRATPGFAEAYGRIAEGGWLGIAADPDYGGMGLPQIVSSCVDEMMAGANMALSLCPLLTHGAIEALSHHGSDEIRSLYLPRMISGEWTGTMNLTEPQAGTDVGAIRARAEPRGDGTFAVTGQKIYISWGDHDLAENVCHLVLARLPDAAEGTRGISLFLVPKVIPDADGRLGVANAVKAISLEHKTGLHGSPTCVMEYAGATGWLVGDPHQGMGAMFTMMNNARLGVGVQGVAQADAALQAAVAFAKDRRQGRTGRADEPAIIGHADVRRMLGRMAALTATARAICLDCALSLDMGEATGDAAWHARAAFLTPIAKAFGTDVGCEVAELAVQVHGGMGYIEETGVAQYYRDVRVTAIYEGTNGIQAMDFVGRKLADGGAAARALLAEVAETAGAGGDLGADLARAAARLGEATEWMLAAGMEDRFAGAAPFLRAFALVLGGHYLLKGALADAERMPLAAFHARCVLPAVGGLCDAACEGAETLHALDFEA
jgi:alkylation response protein AidB-like acyl-CoA dehydrogenase